MNGSNDEILLAFLEGTLPESARAELLTRLDSDPALLRDLRHAARGMEAIRALEDAPAASAPVQVVRHARRISPWWVVAASAATLILSVPTTLYFQRTSPPPPDAVPVRVAQPDAPEPSFVLVLHGRWPDAADVTPEEVRRRAAEYWQWTSSLAEEGLLVAAGDLRWEPGERLDSPGTRVMVAGTTVDDPDFMVGMFTVRVTDYDRAVELARGCPHLRYGGSVSVRRVAGGFVTVPGMGDAS